jgi:PHD/YefM family antitoxin component YafN of YafNO toxin-antitoxin module
MRAIVILSSEQGVERMKTVNALTVRNKLGEILETLTKTGEPILVSKGRQVRAVLITPEDFQKRFLDLQAAEAKEKLLQSIKEVRAGKVVQRSSLEVLRELRGYRQ